MTSGDGRKSSRFFRPFFSAWKKIVEFYLKIYDFIAVVI